MVDSPITNVYDAPKLAKKKGYCSLAPYETISPFIFGNGELARVMSNYAPPRGFLVTSGYQPNIEEIPVACTYLFDRTVILRQWCRRWVYAQFGAIKHRRGKYGNVIRQFDIDPADAWAEINSDKIPSLKSPQIFLPIGYKAHENLLNGFREKIFKQCQEWGLDVLGYQHPAAIVQTENIGIGNLIFELTNIQSGCTVRDNNIFWGGGVHVGHKSYIGSHNWIATGTVISGGCIIGNNNFFGVNASVGNNVNIGTNCLIGMGAVISKDVPDNSVAIAGLNNIIDKKSWEISFK